MTATAGPGAAAPDFTEPAPQANPPAAGLMTEVSNVISSARRVVSGLLDLVVLEGKRAGMALAWMLGLGVAAAILAVTAWLGLMAVAALTLMLAGVPPIFSILIVVLLNLAAAGGAAFVCVKKSKDLLFPATRRQVARKTSELPAKT